ncbi:MAG: ABC-F family ATP-binding cassette domain-containing protein [Actinomycetota bacterium]|nr:ABC-F family ATP-binding cassette domain-containing protein [Actinomycetota bacterium]
MPPLPVNLVNLERVHKAYGIRPLLDGVSLGVGAGQRVGVVGRNGDGKTTLLRLLSGREQPDEGRVTLGRGLRVAYLPQTDDLGAADTLRDAVLGGMADHEWAADPRTREVVTELTAGMDLDRGVEGMSGGERRRANLARLLLGDHDLLVLDEPTNHLDVEAIDWLARHLAAAGTALVVVTHDRWFLDAVCDTTWEVHDGRVDAYDGGYAAYVLAKAERQRQAASLEQRRRNLVRKELAWLRRGPPARTSKPQFRIDAANELIADVPPARDRLELERFAAVRLGKDVLDLEHVDLALGGRSLLDGVTWRLGPGDRVGLVGINGAGKTSVLRLLADELGPDRGRVKRGRTVALEHLSQTLEEIDPGVRVLDSIEQLARVVRTARGELSATSLLERFGFTGDRLTARVGDLSGGERRRLQVLRLLAHEPNVLLLDEPTNDLDIETLTVLEDHLDQWPGTLVVVSHDRYFLERVTDTIHALPGDGTLVMQPGGVEQFLQARRRAQEVARTGVTAGDGAPSGPACDGAPSGPVGGPSEADRRQARKDASRLERQLARLSGRAEDLHARMAAEASDYARLGELQTQLGQVLAERGVLEEQWLEVAELADG